MLTVRESTASHQSYRVRFLLDIFVLERAEDRILYW